jgi:thiol-disulfide isomerase/thioredoxin
MRIQAVVSRRVTRRAPSRWMACGVLLLGLIAATGDAALCQEPSGPRPAPGAGEAAPENPFPDRLPAPSLDGGTEWLNTSSEISLRELRGKVVLLDFWTYCCINCIHILPDLKYLEQKYADQLVVIGVHVGKFDNEKDPENIRRAILRYEIEHPVVNDANMVIAEKYRFSSWPTLALIDPEGRFVGRQPGEGNRELFDEVIGKIVEYHRAKGTLDETPVRFDLEREKVQPGPLKFPGKVLADERGNRLFVSDSNHNRIVISTLDGRLLDVVGSGAIGRKDGAYDLAAFDHPQGMSLVGETLYVADTENHALRAVDLSAKTVSTLAGTGAQARARLPGGPLATTPLNSPWDLQHLDGTLYIAMAGPHQLWQHRLGGETINFLAGTLGEDIVDGPHNYCALAQPSGITTDGKVLYFVDSEGSAVRRATLGDDGEVVTIAGPHDLARGRALFEFGDVDGAGDDARLQHPLGIVYHDGFLYVADTYNHKIRRVDPKSRECVTWLGTGRRGMKLDPVELSEPAGVTIAGGQLLIADTNNHRILSVDLQTRRTGEFTIAGLQPPDVAEEQATPGHSGPDPVDVALQRVRSGPTLRFSVAFDLPEGFKLNQLGPVTYSLKAAGEQTLIAADQLDVRREASKGEADAMFDVPLATPNGRGTYELALSYTYCRSGAGGVCRLAKQTWRVPVEVTADAADEALQLTAAPAQ